MIKYMSAIGFTESRPNQLHNSGREVLSIVIFLKFSVLGGGEGKSSVVTVSKKIPFSPDFYS